MAENNEELEKDVKNETEEKGENKKAKNAN